VAGIAVGAVGIEIASLLNESNKDNGVAQPPHSNWSLLEPHDKQDIQRIHFWNRLCFSVLVGTSPITAF